MTEKRTSLESEQQRVNSVIELIKLKLKNIEDKSGSLKGDIVQLRKTFWDDVTVNLDEPDDVIESHTSLRQQAELLSERERSHGLLAKQKRNLLLLSSSPYFGRIDFRENGEQEAESVYIGLFSLMDENNEQFLVYDWRAPISSMYYDYVPGPAGYETMDGIIEGEMELKRQYIIRNGNIKGMFDTGITIGDEMLQEVLSQQADANMKTIVSTIQKEQNAIIRNDRSRYLIVQGAAGSGKTSAALQRVAYTLYKYRGRLQADQILLFSPNPLFNSYVSNVLPQLGEENMEQSTFYQYLLHRLGDDFVLEHPYNQMEFILSAERTDKYFIRKESIRFKASLEYKSLLDRYLEDLKISGMIFRNIVFRKETIVSAEEISDYFYSFDHKISLANRIHLVKDWLLDKLQVLENEERTKEWVEEERDLLEREDYLKAYKKLQKESRFSEKTFNDFEREERLLAEWIVKRKLKPLKNKIEKLAFLDVTKIYIRLFKWAKEGSNTILPKEWEAIGKETWKRLKNRLLPYEDATPLLYLKDKLEGKQAYMKIRHLFIDEAQDYSSFQFSFMKEIFPNSKMTILGDINQSIAPHSTGDGQSNVTDTLFPDKETETIVLSKSYRSTKPITQFTQSILKDSNSIIPFNRSGEKPLVIKADHEQELHSNIAKEVVRLQNKGYETIAIICKTMKEAQVAYNNLKNHLPLQLIKKETHSYERGVLVIPSYLSKGIEFDAVIIYDCSSSVYFDEDERKLFYTVCTRAMHELLLFYIGEKSIFIQEADSRLYREASEKKAAENKL